MPPLMLGVSKLTSLKLDICALSGLLFASQKALSHRLNLLPSPT